MEQKPRSGEEILKIESGVGGGCSRQRAWRVQRARSRSELDELEKASGTWLGATTSVGFKWEPLARSLMLPGSHVGLPRWLGGKSARQ